MPNATHIHIPLSLQLKLQGEWDEYDTTKQTVRRPSNRNRQMQGRVWTIENRAVLDQGKYRSLNALQVACLALEKARRQGFDVIRVITPVDLSQPGAKVAGEKDFSVAWLAKTMVDMPAFFPDVIDGKINLEDEATNDMPPHWGFALDGASFAPTT